MLRRRAVFVGAVQTIEASGDTVADIHLWWLGPGHLEAILSVATNAARNDAHYRAKLARMLSLTLIIVEIMRARAWTKAA